MCEDNNNNLPSNNNNNEVTIGEWVVTYLIMLIPFVNIIMMFVWAFGNNTKPSKANYFKATLIITAICIVISIVLSLLFGLAIFECFSRY